MGKGPENVYDKSWWRPSHFRSDDFNLVNRKHSSVAESDVNCHKSYPNPNTNSVYLIKKKKKKTFNILFIHITFNSWNINSYNTQIQFQNYNIFKENCQC